MAITFKESNDKKEKKSRSSIKIVRKIFFALSVISMTILIFYLLGRFASFLLIMPLIVFWLIVVLFPTAVTIGIVWVSDGYRKFVGSLNNAISNMFNSIDKTMDIAQKTYPYVGSVSLAIVIIYFAISLIGFKKDKINNKTNLIVSLSFLIISIIFYVVDFVYYHSF